MLIRQKSWNGCGNSASALKADICHSRTNRPPPLRHAANDHSSTQGGRSRYRNISSASNCHDQTLSPVNRYARASTPGIDTYIRPDCVPARRFAGMPRGRTGVALARLKYVGTEQRSWRRSTWLQRQVRLRWQLTKPVSQKLPGVRSPLPTAIPSPLRYATPTDSFSRVRAKIFGQRLSESDFAAITNDVVDGRYSSVEMASCSITACAGELLNLDETIALTRAMIDAGSVLRWDRRPVMDKHCVQVVCPTIEPP